MSELILSLAGAIIPVILAWVGSRINEYFKLKQKEDIVKKVVEYVEQTCKGLASTEKYNKALQEAVEWLEEKGLTASEIELKVLIESSVRALSDGIKGG